MAVFKAELSISSEGNSDIIDITDGVAKAVRASEVADGIAHVFVAHSTAAVTTIEYEPGCVDDLKQIMEKLVPESGNYSHNRLAGDSNAHSHLRAAIVGPSLTLPVADGRLVTGTWQQVVLADFDNRPRQRKVTVQVIG